MHVYYTSVHSETVIIMLDTQPIEVITSSRTVYVAY